MPENANMSERARAYDSGAMGGRDGLAPRLSATDDFGTVTAKFDGVDDIGSVLIDRKLSVHGSVWKTLMPTGSRVRASGPWTRSREPVDKSARAPTG